MRTSSADDRTTSEITLFICKLSDHLGFHFPEEDLKEWSALASVAMCVEPHSKLMFKLNASISKNE